MSEPKLSGHTRPSKPCSRTALTKLSCVQAGLRSELEVATDEMERAQQRLATLEKEREVLLQGSTSVNAAQAAMRAAPNKIVEDSLRNELQNQVRTYFPRMSCCTRACSSLLALFLECGMTSVPGACRTSVSAAQTAWRAVPNKVVVDSLRKELQNQVCCCCYVRLCAPFVAAAEEV